MDRALENARAVVQRICRLWFEENNVEGAAALLSDDVCFVGTSDEMQVQGRERMQRYIRDDINKMREPFAVELNIIQERVLAKGVCSIMVFMTLSNSIYSWKVRGGFILSHEKGSWLIRGMNFSESAASQREGEHYPLSLVSERIMRQRLELLDEAIPGGMLGGYLKRGLPFYFINKKMLDLLGYGSEEEFVKAIDGLIVNCVHPDDVDAVDESVYQQLTRSGEYTVEYRMRKKDGSYIWVHDVGKAVEAEDGQWAVHTVSIDITEQKKAREELLNLYNNIPGAVFRCRFDRDFTVIDANDSLFDFLGYSRSEFAAMGNKMSSVIYPDDLEIMAGHLEAQLERGNTIKNENRLICKDGTVKWISIKAQLFKEEDGQEYFYCVFVDITEEKQLQSRIRDLYEKELSYFAELSSGDWVVQGRLNVTGNKTESYVSAGGRPAVTDADTYDEAIEKLACSVVSPEKGDWVRRTLKREKVLDDYAAGKVDYSFDCLLRMGDGTAFWGNINLRAFQNPESDDIILFFHTFDVTERKMQERMLSKLTEMNYDGIIEIDVPKETYRMISVNNEQSDVPLAGSFRAEMEASSKRCVSEDRRKEFLTKLNLEYMIRRLEVEDSYSFAVEMRDPGGRQRVKRYQIFYLDKELRRACVARTDVTDIIRQEQKQKEEMAAALAAAEQANAAKSDFLSRMSHEIRTPMNAIIGMSAIAAQSIGNDEQVADCISKIGISSRFLLSLINDILDMSRIESGKMLLKNEEIPTMDFIHGINAICYPQAEARGVDFECVVDPALDDFYIGDAMKLQQVLINILNNAIKFTGEGGKVTFSAGQLRKTKSDAVLRFVVNDTGVGMEEEFLPHIFEPFSQETTGTTALYGGTGLGLAISKNIVDMMDGKITVRSIKGIGSEFTIDVKLGLTEQEISRRKKKETPSFTHLKTLVVDDDVTVCESAVAALKEMGVKAEWVDSGRKAVALVEKLWNSGKYFDMILIDWKMPEMDGIETARRIRKIVGPDVTIIIITAYDWSSIEHEARMAGVNLLMSKPLFKSSLVSAFTRALGEKEDRSETETAVNYDFSGKRVLLAEDNQINTEVAVMLLESKGFAVDTVENGLRAMECYGKAPSGYYDAILMDIRMPIMDGLTAASNIRHMSNEDARTIPIIAMTANAFDDDIEKSKIAGMNAHLAKPIEPERLFATLYDFIFGKED